MTTDISTTLILLRRASECAMKVYDKTRQNRMDIQEQLTLVRLAMEYLRQVEAKLKEELVERLVKRSMQ